MFIWGFKSSFSIQINILIIGCSRCQALTSNVFAMKYLFTILLSFDLLTGCRPLNSRITSSNDNNCSSITIIITTRQVITKTCTVLLDRFLRRVRSPPTQWLFRWPPTTPCINRTHSFFHRTDSIWTCTSRPSAVRAICLMVWTAEITTSSMDRVHPTTPCSSHPANVLRSWINNRIIAKFHLNNSSSRMRNRICRLRNRAPTLQMAMLMAPSARPHLTINKRNSKTANYWTAWIHSITARIRPINIIFWSPIKKLVNWHSCWRVTTSGRWYTVDHMLYELMIKRTFFLIRFLRFLLTFNYFVSRFMSVIFIHKFLLRKNVKPESNPRSCFFFLYENYFLYIEL